ncbi:hypothetical protein T440DRAFT_558664 [Plenodomus tracheiphilus IPT5]|uniref:Uncharacterized protein n=1 Tax=Plenodomus tracheiphilus IPT5 TaxID=1408161 RepID=A0A6A7AUD0_9PLEO|nr:hypothetical protein T440DRAFT_558664 [Plenodomus tracheiphilus IPT5]
MDQTPKSPYITAVLRAPEPELDLSGSRPFSPELVVTLHAPKPILLYAADTFLSPPVALCQGGIEFLRKGSDLKPDPRSTIHVNRGHGPDRPWLPNSFLTLEPEKPTLIQIPFGSGSPSTAPKDGQFSNRLWMNTVTFETGNTYEAVLPSAVKVSWRRWERQVEDNDDKGVPFLPEEEQLPICVGDDNVTFTCVGQHAAPPTLYCKHQLKHAVIVNSN